MSLIPLYLLLGKPPLNLLYDEMNDGQVELSLLYVEDAWFEIIPVEIGMLFLY